MRARLTKMVWRAALRSTMRARLTKMVRRAALRSTMRARTTGMVRRAALRSTMRARTTGMVRRSIMICGLNRINNSVADNYKNLFTVRLTPKVLHIHIKQGALEFTRD
jgi:hypothetical protein